MALAFPVDTKQRGAKRCCQCCRYLVSSLVESVLEGVDDLDAVVEGIELDTTTTRVWEWVSLVQRNGDINVDLGLDGSQRLGNYGLNKRGSGMMSKTCPNTETEGAHKCARFGLLVGLTLRRATSA